MSLPTLHIVLAGHVDHGKSTIVGRLLADSGLLPVGKLEQVKAYCERNARPFEYAFLIDALKNEQAQGVTIDSARVFFRQAGHEYILIDAPGHIEFIRNMVTGASRADAALMVVDAQEGIRENSKRHGALLAMLGIQQVVVLVNKMDLVAYRQDMFEAIKKEFTDFLGHWSLKPKQFLAVSGLLGENIVKRSTSMPWYKGPTVLECLAALEPSPPPVAKSFRMWVQDVYKFTNDGDTRRIVAGTIESGVLSVGDHVIFHPSGKKSSVKSIEEFHAPVQVNAQVPRAIGFSLSEQVYVSRGELASRTEEAHPHISSRVHASIFWLGREPMIHGKDYILKIGTAKLGCRLAAIHSVQNGVSLELRKADRIGRNEIADCDVQLTKAIAFDLANNIPAMGRFVIVDRYEISGGGIIREAIEDEQSQMREKILLRDYRWEPSNISAEDRAARFGQKPALIIVTGKKDSGKKPLARALEQRLLDEGHFAYFIGIGNVLYGIDADIQGKINTREEHLRRLGEITHLMLGTGAIIIATAIELSADEIDLILTRVQPETVITVWIGDHRPADIRCDLLIPAAAKSEESLATLMKLLNERGVLSANPGLPPSSK